jgi:hypothetical protein
LRPQRGECGKVAFERLLDDRMARQAVVIGARVIGERSDLHDDQRLLISLIIVPQPSQCQRWLLVGRNRK